MPGEATLNNTVVEGYALWGVYTAMYQVKMFTGASPLEVEDQVNRWLKQRCEVSHVQLAQAAATDVVHVTSNGGIQRFTLVVLYEVRENGLRSATGPNV